MKNVGFTLLALLTLLPAAARAEGEIQPEEPTTLRTVKTQVKMLTALDVKANPIPLTEYGDPTFVNEFSFTWGDVFYGGPTFCFLFGQEVKAYPAELGWTDDDRRLTVFPAFGGVLGFRIDGGGFLSAHIELGLGFVIPPYFTTMMDLYPRVTAGRIST